MDINILAKYAGITKRKVKKHLTMKGFRNLTPNQISKYADALNITPEELVNIEKIREKVLKHED